MATPRRMNPVPIQIKQFVKVATVNAPMDEDYGEIRAGQSKTYDSVIDVEGQVVYVKKDEREQALTGDPGNTDGHLTFRRSDLTKAGIILHKGDVITSIAGFAANYKIIEVRPSGHLRGKANLILAYFASNEETNASIRR